MNLKQRMLGRLEVSALGLGCMSMSEFYGTPDTAIAVNGLEKSYKGLKVLKNIQFTVKRGSIFALLGSNGAGKTTTIKIMATLLKPDKGSVQVK